MKGTVGLGTLVAVAFIVALILLSGTLFPGTKGSTSSTTTHQQLNSATTSQQTSSVGQKPSGSGSAGTLSILLTDPALLPSGVARIYITYANLAVHLPAANNRSAWQIVQAAGSIELLGLANVSRTLAVVSMPVGTYDAIMLNLTSAVVSYNGANYSAFLRILSVSAPLAGGLDVNASRPAAALIDLTPVVLNLANQAYPQFVIEPSMNVVSVPRGELTAGMSQVGALISLAGNNWFERTAGGFTHKIEITSVALTQSSLSVVVTNISNQTVTLGALVVSSAGGGLLVGGGRIGPEVRSTLSGMAIFIILPDGTMKTLSVTALSEQVGYDLGAGKKLTLTYSGQVLFIFGDDLAMGPSGVTAGQQYVVTLIGGGTFASAAVVAQ